MTSGLILFAHGARDPRWADPLVRLRARLADRAPALPIELAFLEIMTPDLAGAAATLAARGCRSVAVIPVFLGQGGHVRRDLAALMETLQETHPDVHFHAVPAVGEDAEVVDALASYCLRVLEPAAGVAGDGDGGRTP